MHREYHFSLLGMGARRDRKQVCLHHFGMAPFLMMLLLEDCIT